MRHAKKENLAKIEKFPEKHKLLKVIQEEIENLNRSITSQEIESVI